jgi:CheY-like chemotaxis protein
MMKPLRLSVYPDGDLDQVRISGSFDNVHDGLQRDMNGIDVFGLRKPSVVVLDLQAAHSCSCDVILDAVRRDADLSDVPIVVCSADEEFLQNRRPLLQGLHCDLLAKPSDLEALLETIENALADQSHPASDSGEDRSVSEKATVPPESALA